MRLSQTINSLGLLAVLATTCVVTDLLARNRELEQWLTAKSSELADKTGTIFSDTGNFIDFEDRVLLDEIPHADYSRGGVYFFGTSNMKWAFTTWDLPAEQKRFIGNYGIGASNHTIALQLIRYLIEQRGFLTAGERDLVIFGVSFHLAHIDDPSTGFFVSLLHRHGLYTITTDGRIAAVPMSAIEHWVRIEKARSGGLIWNIGRLTRRCLMALSGMSHRPAPGLSDSPDALRGFMGKQWQKNMDSEVEQLREAILLVRSHHAHVKVMLLPQGTWMDELPYKPRYEAMVRALCQATETPLIDFSRSIPDDDFVDSNHLTVTGQEKFRELILEEIIRHMPKMAKSSSEATNCRPNRRHPGINDDGGQHSCGDEADTGNGFQPAAGLVRAISSH